MGVESFSSPVPEASMFPETPIEMVRLLVSPGPVYLNVEVVFDPSVIVPPVPIGPTEPELPIDGTLTVPALIKVRRQSRCLGSSGRWYPYCPRRRSSPSGCLSVTRSLCS